MRGEHSRVRLPLTTTLGSSPHARGAPVCPHEVAGVDGIIPACAGSTKSERGSLAVARDHPRMRGEHIYGFSQDGDSWGSSPHARGALGIVEVKKNEFGIIPACAGSTWFGERTTIEVEDHPRMRGEHSRQCLAPTAMIGSSPHARGARADSVPRGRKFGIIPACAGSTTLRLPPTLSKRDHPRMRGEHGTR